MAMEPIVVDVYLDVYDHDTTPTTIKTIALDSQTRYVRAYLQRRGEVYQPDLNATVKLIALRPDKIGVEGTGSVIELVPASGDDDAIYGLNAEITQAMLAVQGSVLFQFKMEVGTELLRTEVFKANNGRALDGDAEGWTDEFQGYRLDEIAEKLDVIGAIIDRAVVDDTTVDAAVLETHQYIDRRISVHDNGIYINV